MQNADCTGVVTFLHLIFLGISYINEAVGQWTYEKYNHFAGSCTQKAVGQRLAVYSLMTDNVTLFSAVLVLFSFAALII